VIEKCEQMVDWDVLWQKT